MRIPDIRHIALVTALATAPLAVLLAADSVTFILTNGSRATGDIASTSEASPAMPYGELNLEKAGADERSYGIEMVAVIDYVGGRPDNAELGALPGRGQMLVTKDGSRHIGRMASLRGGTLRWTGASGRIEEYSVGQIRRIYLDTEAARAAFDFKPEASPRPSPNAPPPTPPGGRQADGSVFVVANQPWTDAGLTVRRGDVFRFAVTGEIKFGMGDTQKSSADGNPEVRNPRFPVPTMPVGALIGRVASGTPFAIGSVGSTIVMLENGRLMLGINDEGHTDNAGYFRVIITRGR